MKKPWIDWILKITKMLEKWLLLLLDTVRKKVVKIIWYSFYINFLWSANHHKWEFSLSCLLHITASALCLTLVHTVVLYVVVKAAYADLLRSDRLFLLHWLGPDLSRSCLMTRSSHPAAYGSPFNSGMFCGALTFNLCSHLLGSIRSQICWYHWFVCRSQSSLYRLVVT